MKKKGRERGREITRIDDWSEKTEGDENKGSKNFTGQALSLILPLNSLQKNCKCSEILIFSNSSITNNIGNGNPSEHLNWQS